MKTKVKVPADIRRVVRWIALHPGKQAPEIMAVFRDVEVGVLMDAQNLGLISYIGVGATGGWRVIRRGTFQRIRTWLLDLIPSRKDS